MNLTGASEVAQFEGVPFEERVENVCSEAGSTLSAMGFQDAEVYAAYELEEYIELIEMFLPDLKKQLSEMKELEAEERLGISNRAFALGEEA